MASAAALALLLPSILVVPAAMDAARTPAANIASVHQDPSATQGSQVDTTSTNATAAQASPDPMRSLGQQIALPMTVMPAGSDSSSVPGMQSGMQIGTANGQMGSNRGTAEGPQPMTFWGKRTMVR